MRRILALLPLDWFLFGLLLVAAAAGALAAASLHLPGIFMVVPVAALLGGFVYLRPGRRRAVGLRRAAERLGLTYEGKGNPFAGDPDFDRRHFELLWRPDTTYGFAVRHLVRGHSSVGEVCLFDFRYNSVDANSFDQTVAVFCLAGSLPQFSIVPKGVLERAFFAAASAVGLKRDIDFPSQPGFTRRQLVRGPDESAVRTLFSAPVLELWGSLEPREWSACGAGRWLLVYRDHHLVPPRQLSGFLRQAEIIARAFAGEVTARLAQRSPL